MQVIFQKLAERYTDVLGAHSGQYIEKDNTMFLLFALKDYLFYLHAFMSAELKQQGMEEPNIQLFEIINVRDELRDLYTAITLSLMRNFHDYKNGEKIKIMFELSQKKCFN